MNALGALEGSGLALAMRHSLWLYPAVETVHLVGIALLFGSVAVVDLRLLGLSRTLSVRQLARHALPWTLASFALIVPSGLAMFTAHASDFIASPVFFLKMLLVLAAGLNAALFHAVVYPRVDDWDRGAPPPPLARLSALGSLGIWIAVIACGRLLAYF